MFNLLIKLVVSKLNGLLLLVALTGVVCTHKIQAEEECMSSNVLCYECDSRFDPNCADPFDFSPSATLEPSTQTLSVTLIQPKQTNETKRKDDPNSDQKPLAGAAMAVIGPEASNQAPTLSSATQFNETQLIPTVQAKKLPAVAVCHGCCVKITSKMVDGGTYVKRTCTTNLQINYFMVGLVCMKESGDRGKMCFCETDYCNNSNRLLSHQDSYLNFLLLGLKLASGFIIYLLFLKTSHQLSFQLD